jgi:hypothetical protein
VPNLDDDMDELLRIICTQIVAPQPAPPMPDEGARSRDRLDADDAGSSAAGVAAESLTVPIGDGEMNLGNWDGVVLLDARGPRVCAVDVTLMGATTASRST